METEMTTRKSGKKEENKQPVPKTDDILFEGNRFTHLAHYLRNIRNTLFREPPEEWTDNP
jgi:hypothetical protein